MEWEARIVTWPNANVKVSFAGWLDSGSWKSQLNAFARVSVREDLAPSNNLSRHRRARVSAERGWVLFPGDPLFSA